MSPKALCTNGLPANKHSSIFKKLCSTVGIRIRYVSNTTTCRVCADLVQIWHLLISIVFISSTKQMNHDKGSNTATFQSHRAKTILYYIVCKNNII